MDEAAWLEPQHRTCGSCRYHDVAGLYRKAPQFADGMGNLGYCRFDPPQILTWHLVPPVTADKLPQIEDEAFHATWPLTCEDDWCGHWVEDTRSHQDRFGLPEPAKEAR